MNNQRDHTIKNSNGIRINFVIRHFHFTSSQSCELKKTTNKNKLILGVLDLSDLTNFLW